ncbi:intermembrane lipid transfer protein VPS13A [Parasteatoda tepidariorum]
MFEGVVAYALNKYLGRFVEDLDSEQLNVGIFSGTVHLTDLHLKPEALAGFDLPIEVKGGCIGKISIDIPWTSLYYEPVLVHIEEVLVLAGPTADRKYDPERDKRLSRAHKNKRLEDVKPPDPDAPGDRPRGFMENLATTIVNNVQVSLQNVHIRFEDTVSTSGPLACGLVLQNLTAVTTNSKWRATQIDAEAKSLFKLLKVESLSLYWNPKCPTNTLVKAQLNSDGWKTLLRKGLATFSINGEDFDFIVNPVSLKTKMILNKSKEPKVPKLLVDFVLQDSNTQLTREQFVSMYELSRAFELMSLSQKFRKYFRGLSVKGHAADYWRDAYSAVLEEYVKPYTWSRIKEHRDKYRQYKSMYKEHLRRPNDSELKLDMQLLEDSLDVVSILTSREQAKIEIAEVEPHMVRRVPTRKTWSFWSWFSSTGDETDSVDENRKDERTDGEEELLVVGDKDRSWWSRMTAEERRRLFEGIGYERWGPDPEAALNHIGHKLNFTLANCTLSLINDGKEILVATITHFLSSLETRPGAKAYKVSARTESVVIEGASLENDLVPIITADNITSGSNVPHVFSLDFEKNPSHVSADYGLSVAAEPMEVVYHKYAMKELMDFFELPPATVTFLKQKAKQKLKFLAEAGKEKIVTAFSKHKMLHLNVDLRSPYFVIPEHGSIQQGGSVVVLDTGRFTVSTDLQSDGLPLEESTKMETEERLYDRFNIALSDAQVLFSDLGEEWRTAKQQSETDMHLVPKAKVTVVFSNSVRPDCKTLPKQKLNISLPSLKLNLSDRRVSMIADFLQNIPIPKSSTVTDSLPLSPSDFHLCSHVLKDPTGVDLKEVWKSLHRKPKAKILSPEQQETSPLSGNLQRSFSASDQSDEEEAGGAAERWARIIDLPGFEDNVSASNYIKILFRLVAGEVSIHLARSSDHADKPYLMLRAEKLCVDAAYMEYGPALQASLHRIQLVDKLHKGSSGEYLELISSDNASDMITVLYRKVQANCPEFKSHFHQVEHSLVLDVSTLSVAFHREAFVTLAKFLQYVSAKLKPKSSSLRLSYMPNPSDLVLADTTDPPVPPGATKFSISARLNALHVRLCDTDLELADLRVVGLETDYVLKANEKSVLRVNLTELCMEDLVEDTLYKKILATEGEKVFDIKWVRRSPHHKEVIDARNQDSLPVRVDGSLRIRFGRTVIVLLHTFANELNRFLEPFLNPDATSFVKRSTEEKIQQKVSEFQQSGLRYQVSVEIQAPTVLLPQKATSPNALILQLGELSVENFLQEEQDHCIDNLLIRLNELQLARAVILLDSRMDILEPILEPLKVRLDIKRALKPYHKEGLLYQITGSMDLIKINVGQRDFSTMISVYEDNYTRFQFLNSQKMALSPDNESGPEESMKKLEVFLYASTDVRKESSFAFILEGLSLTLYTDAEDMRSSNARDPKQALTTFTLDEASLSLETTNDRSVEMKCSCQAATLLDLRAPPYSSLRKIFQSYSGDTGGCTGVAGISLSMPPMVDLTYRRTGNGDAAVDGVMEKIRLNVSVSYVLSLMKFVSDALPGSSLPSSSAFLDDDDDIGRQRLPSDCTSGYLSTISNDDHRALSLSLVFRKPEIVLFAHPDTPETGVLVLKMDVMLDYSFNLGQGNMVLSVAGLHVLSCIYGRRKHTMCTVLYPCQIELNRSLRLTEEEVKMSVNVSNIQLCLSAPVVQTLLEVNNQLFCSLQEAEDKRNYRLEKDQKPVQDLWSPASLYKQKWTEPECNCGLSKGQYLIPKYAECFNINIPEVLVWCEVMGIVKNVPILYAKGAFEAEIKDWSTQMNANGELQLEVMYYNEKATTWEPLLEQVLIQEGQYRPLEIMFKVFRERGHPMVCNGGDELERNTQSLTTTDAPASVCSSDSSGNETEDDGFVTNTVIKRKMPMRMKRLSSIAKSRDAVSFVAFPGDSDSDNEDGVLEKIASTFDHLFSDDEEGASDEPPSDSEGIADVDAHSDSGETETADNEDVFDEAAPVYSSPHRHHHHEHRTVDAVSETALYLTIDCRDNINVNVTPAAVSVLQDLASEYVCSDSKLQSTLPVSERKELLLKNALGPEATLKILRKEGNGQHQVIEEVRGRTPKQPFADPDLVTPLVDISPADSDSEMAGDDNDGFHMSGISAPALKHINTRDGLYEEKSISQLYEENTSEKLSIEIETFDKLNCLLPNRTTTTMYALQPVKNKTRYFVLVDTEIFHGQKIVTVRSPLKIQNHLERPVYILCEKSALESAGAIPEDYSKNPFQDKFVRVATLESGDIYDLPLLVAYHCKLFFRPQPTGADQKVYNLSTEGIWWKDMTVPQKSSKFLQCYAENNTECVSSTKVVCVENRDLKTPSVGTKLVPNFSLHLYPPLVFHNLLPLTLDIHVKNKDQTMRLKEGENATFFDFDPQQPQDILLEVGQYVGLQWHGKMSISGDTEEHHPVSMSPETDTGGGNRHLSLHVHITRDRCLDVYLFAPYWIVNKSGLPLQFRGAMSDAVYEAALTADPLLFRFKKHKKKKAKLRVYSSQWSRSFSLDTVGNCGVVICADKERNKKYHFFVSVEMSKMLLTKVIVIKPFFLVVNNTENHLRFMEKNEATDLWFDIAPEKCLPFWPDTDSLKLLVKLRDSKTVSQHFPIDFPHVTVLRMECGSALKVDVKCGEDFPTTIAFQPYVPGDAPVRVDNYCEDLFLKIHQKSQSQVTLLNPYQSVHYTWDDPSKERTLIWNLYNRKKSGFPAKITRDGYGFEKVSFHSLRKTLVQQPSFKSSVDQSSSSDDDSESEDGLLPKKTRKDKVVVHWVSYVEKEQRVLLFTQDDRVARLARKVVDGERAYLECFLSLNGIGLSLVNDAHRELAYASLTSCPAIWEIEINHSWKLLTLELSAWLEDKWNADQQKAQLKDYLQVDLSKMQMIKPFFGQLRRFYSPAFWLQLRKSSYQTYAHFKIHRFQIDNQLPDAVFPTVLHPGTTPQYIVRRSGPKPFFESAFLLHSYGATKTLKFWKVLLQEVHLHLDKGFLLSVHDMVSRFVDIPDEVSRLREDLKTAQAPLFDLEQQPRRRGKKGISIEYVHLSPVVIHFSFSPRGTVFKPLLKSPSLQGDVMDLLLNSIGATLSEVKDVEIKLAFFERRGFHASYQELLNEIRSHYKSQAVQQAYVLILGLDILGNPFGLLKDFTRGLGDFFYEPYLGSIKGPDEFAESLARGAQSLLGHVIGGSAGAISLITGSLGQTFSVLTFDEDYRKKRQYRQQHKSSSLPDTLFNATKSFVLGVGLGLSGVVTQPITGGQQEGVEGFFRGIGKGLLGLITKPAGGVMDMVSMAFDGIRRAAEMGESVVLRMRLPRYINPSEGLRPYSPYLASGCHLLEEVSKGHYAETDIYWAHAALSPQDRIRVALVTDRHLFLLEKSRFWSSWDVEWMVSVDDVLTVPHIHKNNLVIKVKQEDWILNFAGDERYIQSDDPIILEWLKDKIEKVLLYNMRGKPCPI